MDVPIISIISIKEILLFSTGTVRYSDRDLSFMWFPVTAWKCRAPDLVAGYSADVAWEHGALRLSFERWGENLIKNLLKYKVLFRIL